MRQIFADTSFLVSFYNQQDSNHKKATSIAKSLEGQNILWIISDYIFDEFLTVLLVRNQYLSINIFLNLALRSLDE